MNVNDHLYYLRLLDSLLLVRELLEFRQSKQKTSFHGDVQAFYMKLDGTEVKNSALPLSTSKLS